MTYEQHKRDGEISRKSSARIFTLQMPSQLTKPARLVPGITELDVINEFKRATLRELGGMLGDLLAYTGARVGAVPHTRTYLAEAIMHLKNAESSRILKRFYNSSLNCYSEISVTGPN